MACMKEIENLIRQTKFYKLSIYKQEALPKIRSTIEQFKELASIGEQQITRLEKGARINL